MIPVGQTAGRWDPAEGPKYFLAQNISNIRFTGGFAHDHLLAVNEIRPGIEADFVEGLLDRQMNVFIDSGVYNLATQHAATHNLTMDQALSLPPSAVDGFQSLFDKYVWLAQRWQHKAWAFVEIDFGGRENKIKTRARLEGLGLRPIPVLHPINDGIEYFQYLAERYDRICVGNVVQANIATRKRLVATMWELRQRFPKLWIHLLGLTASPLTLAFPANSCDSSTWVAAARWGQVHASAATQRLWDMGAGWTYDRQADSKSISGHHKSWAMSAYDAGMMGRAMRGFAEDQARELGCDITGGSIKNWPAIRWSGTQERGL